VSDPRRYARKLDVCHVREGIIVCKCIPEGSPTERLLIDVGDELPPGTIMDAVSFDCGHKTGVCAVLPDGRAHATKFVSDLPPSAPVLAAMFKESLQC
jgi:hypothetical protein